MGTLTLKKGDKEEFRSWARKYGAIGVFLLLCVINMIFTRNFLKISTVWNVIMQMAPTMYIAVGMTFVIGTAGIDLSVGSILAFTSITLASLLAHGWSLLPAILVTLVIGAAIGCFNGFMVNKMRIEPIILTIVMQMVLRGCAIFVSNGKSIPIASQFLKDIGLYRFPGKVPVQIIFVVLVMVVGYFLAQKMSLGSYVEAIGVNAKAAKLTGVRFSAVIILVYMLSGLLASMAGVLEVARSGAVDPSIIGDMYEVDAIAAVAIGGTSLNGGKPNIIGTMFGVIIMILIKMMINMNDIPYELSNVVKAFIILFSLYIQRERKS
ncbi:MAG: ABC transporter permease [Lachnospiraceae bacterium]|nr:ABC transporter permease [Lachnospiraceae bacterium]